MSTDQDFRARLERLGIGKGPRQLKPRRQDRGKAIEHLLPGEVVDGGLGSFFLYRERYAPDYVHGHHTLAELAAHDPNGPALLARDERLAGIDYRRMAFIDTETTGLAGGTGTYAFLVGVGVFGSSSASSGGGFVIHQFFMRDYDEEGAQLEALGELLDGLEAVVSFNGKSFDMPLLETRFVMARQDPRLTGAPHLDLLPAARRFWKYRLASCALSALEPAILGVERTGADVPGWLIPSLYADYARTGDAGEMPGIFYHNAQDILSLVTLTARMCDLLATPPSPEAELPGEDAYGLGRLLYDLGRAGEAETAYALAAHTSRSPEVRDLARRDLAYLLKRHERRDEAVAWWRRLAESGAIYAFEELAKHYEWHDEDLAQALAWTEQGIGQAESWPRGPKRSQVLGDLEHRRERLQEKLAARDTG